MFLCTCISQERERKEEEERIRTENLLRGNPLLNQQQNSSFKIKRRLGERSVRHKIFGVFTRRNLSVRAFTFPKVSIKTLIVLYYPRTQAPPPAVFLHGQEEVMGTKLVLYLHVL